MNMSAPLPSTSGVVGPKTDADYPTRFVDIKPGSTIRVGGPRVGGPAFEGLVLQAKEEWGATGEPAVYISRVDGGGELWISQAAQYEVTVTADASMFINESVPPNALRVRVRPITGIAMQFKGGIESATEVITWLLGRAAPQYFKGTDELEEAIVFSGLNGADTRANPGDWIILHDEDTSIHVHGNLSEYEEQL
jgi:hypothetical protein